MMLHPAHHCPLLPGIIGCRGLRIRGSRARERGAPHVGEGRRPGAPARACRAASRRRGARAGPTRARRRAACCTAAAPPRAPPPAPRPRPAPPAAGLRRAQARTFSARWGPGGGRRAVCAQLLRVAGAPHSNACVSARRMPCPSRLAEHALALTYCEPPFCHPPIAGQPSMHTRRASTARLLHAMTHLARAFLQGLVGGRAHQRCRCSGRRCRRARCTPRATHARCRRRCRTRRCCRPRTP